MAVNCSRLAANVAAASCRFTGHAAREVALVNFDDWELLQRTRGGDSPQSGEVTCTEIRPTNISGTYGNIYFWDGSITVPAGSRLSIHQSPVVENMHVGLFTKSGNLYYALDRSWANAFENYLVTRQTTFYLGSDVENGGVTYEFHMESGGALVVEVVDGVVKIRPDGAAHKVFNFFETADKGIVAAAEEVVGAYFNAFRHRITLRSFDRPQALKDYINGATNGRFVAFVRFDVQDPTAVPTSPDYVVYGAANGLVAESSAFDSSNGDGQTGEVTLASEDGRLEGGEALPLFGNGQDGTAATPAAAWEWVESNRVE